MFIHILAHHVKNRVIKFRFQRSGETISRHFQDVLNALMRLEGLLLKKPEPVLVNSTDEKWKWFKNCLGALDGTHIKVRVPIKDKPRYSTRKGEIATNMLGVCSQDMQFIYILPGWEGSTADSRVLREAMDKRNGFKVPQGYYYLVDAGYTNCQGFLAPYRGQRYHLNDWRDEHQPTTPREFYNMKHSSARNVIDRCFGLLKMRWAIMRSPSFYSTTTQTRIILACCLLHNLIRMEFTQDQIRGAGNNKRMWTDEEDMKLIEALLDLHNTGLYNADRGFKPGHVTAVEKILAVTLPYSYLKANPHIKSRMKTLKTHFVTVHDMLHGPNTSGFGYDNLNHCVVAEKSVWDAYLQSHKNAAKFKDKPFPYYKDLCTIFGKDRATGNDAETAADVMEKLDKERMNKENDDVGDGLDDIDASISFMQSPTIGKTHEVSSKNKKKRKSQSVAESLCEVVKQSSTLIGSDIKSSTERLSQAIKDASINELKIRLHEELMKLPSLNKTDRAKALAQIGRDRDLIQIFFTLDEDMKEELVKTVIS
ncbi:uncharacterized protein LOC132281246 [Cornus florida]|uniref:uncharacterized protein LOC132281246 n=1 Tax=Cornus florida TaxID=4283 RepID=UPI00289AFD2B|nr:uncharacterized protein LOC132281246 [Cornus florida]